MTTIFKCKVLTACKMWHVGYLCLLLIGVAADDELVTDADSPDDLYAQELLSCPPRDSCIKSSSKFSRMQDELNWKRRNCACDEECLVYGDCCRDAERFNETQQRWARERFRCTEMRQFGYIYMRNNCPGTWTDQRVRELCEGTEDNTFQPFGKTKDPMGATPVTSISGITYANYYCSLCHGDAVNTTFWNSRIECPKVNTFSEKVRPVTPEEIQENLRFNESVKFWGIDLESNGTTEFYKCFVDPIFPETVVHFIRPCKDSIASCPEDYENEEVISKCLSYTAFVYPYGNEAQAFRNPHCSLCHNVSQSLLKCSPDFHLRKRVRLEFSVYSFSMLLDVGAGNGIVGKTQPCEDNQLYDPFHKTCRVVWCNEGSQYMNGRCEKIPVPTSKSITANSTSESSTSTNEEETTEDLPIVVIEDLEGKDNATLLFEKKSCPKVYFNPSQYEINDKGKVTIKGFHKVLNPGDYKIAMDTEFLWVCTFDGLVHMASKYNPVMGYVSDTGALISMICLILHLIAFCTVPELKNLSGKNMACLSICLLGGFSSFLLGQFDALSNIPAVCSTLGGSMYYFFLSSFFWMNVLAFDVWRTLRLATTELRSSSGRQMRRFMSYCIYGWLIPIVFLGIAVLCDFMAAGIIPEKFTPGFGKHTCWFGNQWALLIYFGTPLGCIMMANIILFFCSSRIVYKSSKDSSRLTTSCTPRINLKLYAKLAVIMGLTWIFGLIAGFSDSKLENYPILRQAMSYIHILFNTLQGLFIFISFTCTKRVKEPFLDRFRGNSKKRSLYLTYSNNSNRSRQNGLAKCNSNDSHNSTLSNSSLAYTQQSSLDPILEKC